MLFYMGGILNIEHAMAKGCKPSKTPVRNSDQALAKSLGVTLNHTKPSNEKSTIFTMSNAPFEWNAKKILNPES